jgi:Spy/CpxP family protein refolding chaperone
MFLPRCAITRFVLRAAIALFVTSTIVAKAQPPMPPAGGDLAPALLATDVHVALALTTLQETQWQQLKADEAALRTQLDTTRQSTAAAIDAELARNVPDFDAIETALESAQDTTLSTSRGFHQRVLAFYTALAPEQQAIVIAKVKADARQHAGNRPPMGNRAGAPL